MVKRVTGEQEIGELGELQVRIHFTQLGWKPRALSSDLGEDLIVDIYDQGVSAGLAFYVQVKSSANISKFRLKTGERNFSYPIEIKDLNHWRDSNPAVVIVIWDTVQLQGYWITVADAISVLDKRSPGWENKKKPRKGEEPTVNVPIPQSNELSKDGVIALRHKIASPLFPVFSQGKELYLRLDFSFPEETGGEAQHEALQRFFEQGEGVSIDGRFIKGIHLSDWFERKFGKVSMSPDAVIHMGPRYSDEIFQFRLTLLTSEGRALQKEVIEVKAVRIGTSQVTFSNEHSPTPFFLSMVCPKEGQHSVNLSLERAKLTGSTALKAYDFFENARNGGAIRVEILPNDSSGEVNGHFQIPIMAGDFPQLPPGFRDVLTKLHFIETKIGMTFPVVLDNFAKEDWYAIYETADTLERGKIASRFGKQTMTLTAASNPNSGLMLIRAILKNWSRDKVFSMESHIKHVSTKILGVTVHLGECRASIKGGLSLECAQKLLNMERAKVSPMDLELVLIDGEQVHEFHEWMTEPRTLPPLP